MDNIITLFSFTFVGWSPDLNQRGIQFEQLLPVAVSAECSWWSFAPWYSDTHYKVSIQVYIYISRELVCLELSHTVNALYKLSTPHRTLNTPRLISDVSPHTRSTPRLNRKFDYAKILACTRPHARTMSTYKSCRLYCFHSTSPFGFNISLILIAFGAFSKRF